MTKTTKTAKKSTKQPAAKAPKRLYNARKLATKAPVKRAAKEAPAKAAPPKLVRATKEDCETFTKGVIAMAHLQPAIASGDIMAKFGISRGRTTRAIKAAMASGKLFRGGDKRFARYATTQRKADKASAAARGL